MDFQKALLEYDRKSVVEFTKNSLENGYGVLDFYNDYILESLTMIGNAEDQQKYNIVQEHLCTAIIRTVIEICYEYIVTEDIESKNKKVVVCGLLDELHELPPRIVTDMFSMNGYDAYFLGTNIPSMDIVDAINHLNVDYVAISITNFLHLTAVSSLIEQIKNECKCKIIIGGLAVVNNLEFAKNLEVDYVIENFQEIGEI